MAEKRRRLKKTDLIGHQFERDAAIVRIDEEAGTLNLVHVEGHTEDGQHVLFNGEIRLPLNKFELLDY